MKSPKGFRREGDTACGGRGKKKSEDEEEMGLNSRLNASGVMRKQDFFLCAAASQEKNSQCTGRS